MKTNAIIRLVIISWVLFFSWVVVVPAQSYDHPFVRSRYLKFKTEDPAELATMGPDKIGEMIAYTDAMNRTSQTIMRQASPNNKDVVSFSVYTLDESHAKSYLSYITNETSGQYRADPVSEQIMFYQTALKLAHTTYAYAETQYDGSPLHIARETSSPGYNWRYMPSGSGHTVKMTQRLNLGGEVRQWVINTDNTVSTTGFYPTGSLLGIEGEDENRNQLGGGRKTITFTDISGRTILKKETLTASQELLTYYVYDDFGNLRFIVPPKASGAIPASGTWNSSSCQSTGNDLVFWNKYDEKQRIIQKKIPGKAAEYFVYDKLDRVVMRQDGNLRTANKWYCYKYDIFGRVIQEAIVSDNQPQVEIQSFIDGSTAPSHEERCAETVDLPLGYTDQSYPGVIVQGSSQPILKVNYYDEYPSFVTPSSQFAFKEQPSFYRSEEAVSDRIRGMVTVMKTRVLNSLDQWLTAVNYYDNRGRLIQTVSNNHLGGIDIMCNSYDFEGKVSKTRLIHNYNSPPLPNEVVAYSYEYDNGGRIINVNQKFCPTCEEITYMHYKYNEAGQNIAREFHQSKDGSTWLQSVDYAYNTRGWLTRINKANLGNDNTYIQNEINLDASEVIDGMQIDSVMMDISVAKDRDNIAYLQLNIRDKKTLNVSEINNPANNRTIAADENETRSFSQAIAEEVETYDALNPYENLTVGFSFDGIVFDQYTEIKAMLDSVASLTDRQCPLQGISDTDTRKLIAGLIREFVSGKIGIVFFNEDNDDLFGMELHYDDGPNLQYNGNIASVVWQNKTHNPGQRMYGYTYDRCNRLKVAGYSVFANGSWTGSSENGRYSLGGADNGGIGYDENGNIVSLNRFGQQAIQQGIPVFGQTDQLQYTSYRGNQLDALTDAMNSASQLAMPDFHEKSTAQTGEYGYDANGNMTRDDNKGITSVVYNHMNLPTEINFGSNHKILYLYDANGRKLKKQVIHNAQSHQSDYSGSFQYEDGILTLILTPEGRVVKHVTTYDPQYFLKDYLGNVRVVYHANAETGLVEVVQEDHYDPFGMKLGGLGYVSDIENKYLFQGKEFNDEAIDTDSDGNTDTYMNWYDFEARQFDPQIGRWHVVDPVAQTASPYAAMGNNPVSNIDPNGCAYTGYGSLADRYYYEPITWGGENRLGPLHVRQDPSIDIEMQGLIEIGQMSADGIYGGGSNDIAATLWGCSNFIGDIDANEQWIKDAVKNMTVSVLGGTKEQRELVEKTLKNPDYLQTAIEFLRSGSPTVIIYESGEYKVNNGMFAGSDNSFGKTRILIGADESILGFEILLAPINFFTDDIDVYDGALLGTTLAHETRHAFNKISGRLQNWNNQFIPTEHVNTFDEYSANCAGIDYFNYYNAKFNSGRTYYKTDVYNAYKDIERKFYRIPKMFRELY